jgi:enoyl-CoA hydratase/carnithine racemase
MSGELLLVRDGDIATVTLSNPGKLNALTKPMWMRVGELMRELSADETVHCIVLRGDGDQAFAAGADISEFESVRANAAQAKQYGEDIAGSMRAVAECRHPTVALIQGACVGGGLELASQCDLRICGESSRFGVPIKNLGLVVAYAEMRGLIDVVGRPTALEILLEGRILGAREAYEKKLVTRVVADDKVVEEGYAMARRVADGAPLVARWHKKFARRIADPRPLTEEENTESYACFDTEDFRIGVKAFLAKKKPDFVGR